MKMSIAATHISTEAQISANLLTSLSIDYSAVAEDIIPDADSTRDFGSAAKRWKVLHADDAEGNLKFLILAGI